jgi:hypothetical protein
MVPTILLTTLSYLSCFIMALVYGWYLTIPWLAKEPIHLLVCGSLIYGIAIGCYISVDYALALDCLPENKGPSEALGLWGERNNVMGYG